MKKDRNSFFQEYGMNAYNTNMPIPNMGMNQNTNNAKKDKTINYKSLLSEF